MSELVKAVVKRLTWGASKLSRDDIENLFNDIRALNETELMALLPAAPPPPRPAKPIWLKEIEALSKRVAWGDIKAGPQYVSFAMARSKRVAEEFGKVAKSISLPKAATRIVEIVGEREAVELFRVMIDQKAELGGMRP